MITVLLADDHTMVRDGLRYLLEAAGDIQIIAVAVNGADAVAKAMVYKPDIAVIDISMPEIDGIEATKQINVHCPQTRVLALSMHQTKDYVERLVKAGAFGYLLKEGAGHELVMAVRTLYRGNRYFSQKIAEIAKSYL